MDRVTRWRIECPLCADDSNVHSSGMKWYESPAMLIGKRPYRCYNCGHRFLGSTQAEAMAPQLESTSGESPDVEVHCPNCEKKVELLLSAAEFQAARTTGWYVSCPKCTTAFVYHA